MAHSSWSPASLAWGPGAAATGFFPCTRDLMALDANWVHAFGVFGSQCPVWDTVGHVCVECGCHLTPDRSRPSSPRMPESLPLRVLRGREALSPLSSHSVPHLLGKARMTVTMLLTSKLRLREARGLAQGPAVGSAAELGVELRSASHSQVLSHLLPRPVCPGSTSWRRRLWGGFQGCVGVIRGRCWEAHSEGSSSL